MGSRTCNFFRNPLPRNTKKKKNSNFIRYECKHQYTDRHLDFSTLELVNTEPGRIRGGGAIAPLKPTKETFFTKILYNPENSIRDVRPFRHPLFCHSSVVKYTSCLLTVVNS